MIELRGVSFSYVRGRPALRGVDLALRRGLTAIVGPNGSGKTTMLKVASLIYRPDEGVVLVDGVDPWSLDERGALRVRRRVVYVHERPIMLRGSALDNVAKGLTLRGLSVDEARRGAMEALRELGIAHLALRRAEGLSMGERQLVALARAIALSPDHILLDEPLAHLHVDLRSRVVDLLRALSRDRVVVVATHDLYLASIADRVAVVEEGRVVRVGSPMDALRLSHQSSP